MSKQGEIDYLRNLGPGGIEHAVNKPFSDDLCSRYLVELGTVFALLPPPPGRLLDLGCGTGWTSVFFSRRGYEVTGVDLAPDMIAQAERLKESNRLPNLTFLAADYEETDFAGKFDAVVFFDALHHSLDEVKALRTAYRALKRGGRCVTVEPGVGHRENARAVAERFQTTEKDMNPALIRRAARRAGFRRINVYPQPEYLKSLLYRQDDRDLTAADYERFKTEVAACIDNRELHGIAVLVK